MEPINLLAIDNQLQPNFKPTSKSNKVNVLVGEDRSPVGAVANKLYNSTVI